MGTMLNYRVSVGDESTRQFVESVILDTGPQQPEWLAWKTVSFTVNGKTSNLSVVSIGQKTAEELKKIRGRRSDLIFIMFTRMPGASRGWSIWKEGHNDLPSDAQTLFPKRFENVRFRPKRKMLTTQQTTEGAASCQPK